MQVNQIMSRQVRLASPEDTVQQAARYMAELGTGALAVGDEHRIIGIVTDRDIAIRGDAQGCDPTQTAVSEVMTEGVEVCYEDDEVEQVARKMAQLQVRRLPVLDRQRNLVGIVSIGDLN
jgi:CBS domain-containing protein